jgi:hypothetical protein
MTKLIECEICFNPNFSKYEMIPCKQCKKLICFRCYFTIIKSKKYINKYTCPYCLYKPTLLQCISMLNKLNKCIEVVDKINIKFMSKNKIDLLERQFTIILD